MASSSVHLGGNLPHNVHPSGTNQAGVTGQVPSASELVYCSPPSLDTGSALPRGNSSSSRARGGSSSRGDSIETKTSPQREQQPHGGDFVDPYQQLRSVEKLKSQLKVREYLFVTVTKKSC